MNRIRRLAEELVARYPSLFGPDFDKNKLALAQVTVVRTRSLRNQLAGAITKIIHERGPSASSSEAEAGVSKVEQGESSQLPTIEERARIEGTVVPGLPDKSGPKAGEAKREAGNNSAQSISSSEQQQEQRVTESSAITQ